MPGYNANFWQGIYIRVDPDPFCTSCQISTININTRSKTPMKARTPFKWVLMAIILGTYPKILTKDTTFSNYLLIGDAYSNIPIVYGI